MDVLERLGLVDEDSHEFGVAFVGVEMLGSQRANQGEPVGRPRTLDPGPLVVSVAPVHQLERGPVRALGCIEVVPALGLQ